MHADPSEGVLDAPLMYDPNWRCGDAIVVEASDGANAWAKVGNGGG